MNQNQSKVDRLLEYIANTVPDELDCVGCLELLPIFVEIIAAGEATPEKLICVEIHLSQCACCREKYEIILDCIRVV